MMNCCLLLAVLGTPLIASLSIPAEDTTASLPSRADVCAQVLQSAGASPNFGTNVGHAIHSLTVQHLQKFNPSVTEKNKVPTVNMDLKADEAILPFVPDLKGPDDAKFLTSGMKTVDYVLSHMDDKHWAIQHFTNLERLAHEFHMQEVWAYLLPLYQKLQSVPASAEVCACALDVENNGVLKMLRFTALAIREPGLVYGNRVGGYPDNLSYPLTYRIVFKPNDPISSLDLLKKREEAMPPLRNATEWIKWKQVANIRDIEHQDAALFLHCALK